MGLRVRVRVGIGVRVVRVRYGCGYGCGVRRGVDAGEAHVERPRRVARCDASSAWPSPE